MKIKELIRYAIRHTFKSTQDFFREVEAAETVILSFETWDDLLSDPIFLEMFKQTLDKQKIQKEIIPEVWGNLRNDRKTIVFVDYSRVDLRPTERNCFYVVKTLAN